MNVGEYIKSLRLKHGLTQEELGAKVGVKRAAVQKWECGLTQNLKRTTIQKLSDVFGVSPSLFINAEVNTEIKSNTGIKIPVLGSVVAGIPLEAIEDIIDYEEIPMEMARTGDFFCLQVKGQSMEPKFSEGDVVVVRKQPNVESGEIAIVLVNGNEATIKKIKKRPDGIMLVPLNSAYDVMFYNNDDITNLPVNILGKVVELRAKF